MEQILTGRLKQNLAIGLLITISVIIIVGLLLRRYHYNLERLASTDPLTQAFNRNAFAIIFSQFIKEKNRHFKDLSLILIDIDSFKGVNDKYGHNQGDMVLQTLSKTILGNIRETDVFCRWGGEEFLILLSDCSKDKAVSIAENIREACAMMKFGSGPEPFRITISAGVVEHRAGESQSELIARADRRMFKAKKQGKNQVVFED